MVWYDVLMDCRVGLLVLMFFAFLVCAPIASAQGMQSKQSLAVYGDVMWTNYGAAHNNSGLSSQGGCIGFGGGGFYNFPIESRFTAGIDVRGSVSPCARGGGMGAVSARFAFVPEHVILRPYVEIGGGVVHAKTTSESYYIAQNGTAVPIGPATTGAIMLAFGLDVRVTRSLDLRAIELAAAAGGSESSSEAATASLGSGLVYHFGH